MCAVLITHSHKLSFSVPDISPVGKVNLFGSKMVSWGLHKALLWLSIPLLSHWTYLEKVSLPREVAFKPSTIGLCTKRTLNGC